MGQRMTLTSPLAMQRLAPLGGPLAGRDDEMDVLRRAWAAAALGECRMVLLAGEAGVGKTRLAAELAGEAEVMGAAVLVGGCPVGGAEPYHPLAEALGQLPTGQRERDVMFDTLAHAVAARARRAPVLLILDDLHRADRSTLLALRRLLAVAADTPLLVVGTYRDTAVDRSHPIAEFLAAVLGRQGVERISVEGLTADAVAGMVGDTDLGLRLWRRSSGNPVFVAELLRPGALDGAAPAGFDELVAGRLARLSARARTLVEAAAVAGPEFPVGPVAAAAEVVADRAAAVFRELVSAGFLVDEAGDVRRFVHDMVREAVERSLDASARVRLHLGLGRSLDDCDLGVPALLAWHYRAAAPVGGSARALRHSARAGERAMALLAWDEAAVHFGHALAAATGADSATRAGLLLLLGEAQRLAGEAARARQAFLEAAALARAESDGPAMARAALALGQVASVWGADPELEAVAGEARSLLGAADGRRPVDAARRPVNFATGDLYDVLDGVERVEEAPPPPPPFASAPGPAARHHGDAVALLRARHVALAGPEHARERLTAADELVTVAAASGDEELVVTGLGWRVVDGLELGRADRAWADLNAHARSALGIVWPGPSSDAASWSAMRALLEGRPGDARSDAVAAFDLAVEAGDPEAGATFLVQRWWMALEWPASADLAAVVEECSEKASGPNARSWRAMRALALARSGYLDLAAEELQRVTDHGLGELVRDPGRLHPLACVAEAAWLLDDGYRAAPAGSLLEPFADHLVVAGRGAVCQGSVARVCAMVAASAHRWEEADRYFQSAIAVHRGIGALPLLARTRFEWSTVLLRRGRKLDRRRAAEARRKAVELATGLGMSRLLEEMAGPAT